MAGQHHKDIAAPRNSDDTLSGETLHRQVTIPLTPEVYERLFLQPLPPYPSGSDVNLAKRFGNPTLLGLLGLMIPYQTTIFCLLQWEGAGASSLTAISGAYFFLGGICMNIAGLFELILGNSYSAAVFMIYGSHWCVLGFGYDPAHNVAGSFTANGVSGALQQPFNAGNGFYNLTMTIISFVLFLGSLKTSGPLALLIFCLVPLFAFLAGSDFYLGYNPTPEGLLVSEYLAKVGAGFGLVSAICGWYLTIIAVCSATGVPCPLPTFDLSTHLFKGKSSKVQHAGPMKEEAGAGKV